MSPSISTAELIDRLVADGRPVRRLAPPWLRAIGWLILAVAIVAAVSYTLGFRLDLVAKLQQRDFLLEWGAGLATGVAASFAAFHLSLPDRSARWLWLPAPTLVFWLLTIGYGCLTNWVAVGPGGITLGSTFRCLANVALVSTPLSLVMLRMLRHAGYIRPAATAALGALAIATLTASGLRLFHPLDATILILIWNVGLVAALVYLGERAGRKLFRLS